uniref:Arf-GAP with coiled-coil, ANK repeat and PH domain-containing protein n=1 Tax=Scleropages formosus TaxID=113540 RepID=A0A8D0CDV8_SCLFO
HGAVSKCKLDYTLQLVKLCIGMIDAGKAYNVASKHFVHGIQELAQQSAKDEVVEVFLFSTQILFDQAQRSIRSQLQIFMKEDLRKFREAKKQFDKVSEEKEVALAKNAQAARNKQQEVEEATNILTATRKCFRHVVLDYVLQINVLQSKRRSEILKSMLSFMYAHLTFFHQGYDLFSELQPLMKQLGGQLDQLVIDAAKEKRDMELKHSTIQQKDFSNDDTKLEYNVDADNGIAMEGYLFKRASNAFKTWNRRWFSIRNNQLVYQKKFRDNPTVVVEDLRLCTVKHCEDIERRFCFEVVSPTKSCMMQADSEKLRQAWIKAVQNSIATAFREKGEDVDLDRRSSASACSLESGSESQDRSLKGESALQRVLAIPGNDRCCDCGAADPRWASINLGITLCIQCSGIHSRSLGVHFSKVRSLTLDTWEPELLKLMCELGNAVINGIYEARRQELATRKPRAGDSRCSSAILLSPLRVGGFPSPTSGQSMWRRGSCTGRPLPSRRPNGRVLRVTEAPDPTPLPPHARGSAVPREPKPYSPGLQLFWASCAGSLPDMAEAMAHGAEVNWANVDDDKKTPLIMAVQGGSLVTCEFLLQNAASVNQPDAYGRGPLHHATTLGHTGQVCLFLKRGASQNAVDIDNKTPLAIAVEAANADIVTLLRLAKMNDEMRESEGPYGQSGDETYQDIFRDFSQMASSDPDRLNRFQPNDSHRL